MDDVLPVLCISASSVLVGSLITRLLIRDLKPKQPVQQVAHRIYVPNVTLIHDNKKLTAQITKAEKERDYWKQEAQRWMPKSVNEYDSDINLNEAKDWLN